MRTVAWITIVVLAVAVVAILRNSTEAAAWATAIGTLVLALVTVFGDWFRARFIRPVLEVSAQTDRAHCPKMPLIAVKQTPEAILTKGYDNYQMRIEVRNTGNAMAKDVEVLATELRVVEPARPAAPYPRFLPSNLQWTYNMPLLPRLLPTPKKSPGRFCDVAHVLKPGDRCLPYEYRAEYPENLTWLSLLYVSKPSDLSHLLLPGTYELDIQVAASNADPIEVTLEIGISGEWYDDENDMRDKKGLSIRIR